MARRLRFECARLKHNGSYQGEGHFHFFTLHAMLFIPLQDQTKSIRVEGCIENMKSEVLENHLAEQDMRLADLQRELNAVKMSRSWRWSASIRWVVSKLLS